MRIDEPATRQAGPWGGILLVFFSTHGHTQAVADRIAATLRQDGLDVDLRDVAHAGDVDPERHDVVVVGASLQREPDRREIVAWICDHRAALSDRPTALFSVAGEQEDRGAARRAIDELVAATGWQPARALTIADGFAIDRLADEVAFLAAAPLAA